MFGEFKSRRPPKNFNLLYLESNELYFMSLKVNLLIEPTHQEIEGKLHLCSRSIFFEPKNIAKPLLRIKFSCGVVLRMLKNIETKKVYKLIPIKKSEAQFKTILNKGPNFITQMLQQQEQKKTSRQSSHRGPVFLQKLYEPIIKPTVQEEDKEKQNVSNFFFIRVPKIFIIYRKPISPYITQKSDESHIFQISKSNPKNKILRFLKLYDQLMKCIDEEKKLNRSIISATSQQSAQQILSTHQQQKLQSHQIIRCRRITIQGPQYGQFVLLKSTIKFYPLVNCPDNQVLQFTYREIKFLIRYRYLFQEIGIEMWFYNYPCSVLFVFNDQDVRETVYKHLNEKAEKLMKVQLGDVVNMWANGEITNIQYLNFINITANRSYNDLSQYPIFPWIIHNYDLPFDIKNHQMYRDLTKPIGAINKHRLKKLKDLYEIQTKDKTCTNPPHLYPTHYSTPGFVSYYLIRKIPEFIVRIQNGVFSPSDRIFRCVQSAYYSSMNSSADFKELIPEFYSTECDFLVNSQKLEMGSTPEGEVIDDVLIPKWAANAQDFLLKMRAAFQSDYISATLSQWIDLIFGYKQNGTSAITSDNIFYFLTYQENVSFDKVMPRMQKAALQVQISQFGQTPVKIFQEKHPIRRARILNLDVVTKIDDKKILNAKITALSQQKKRLEEDLERQRYRFNKKLNEKQELLIKNQRQKNKQSQRIREKLSIDSESLKKFEFKRSFKTEQDKDVYIRQIEELLRQKERQNHEMNVVIAGMKRQVKQENQSVGSNIEENVNLEEDFFDD